MVGRRESVAVGAGRCPATRAAWVGRSPRFPLTRAEGLRVAQPDARSDGDRASRAPAPPIARLLRPPQPRRSATQVGAPRDEPPCTSPARTSSTSAIPPSPASESAQRREGAHPSPQPASLGSTRRPGRIPCDSNCPPLPSPRRSRTLIAAGAAAPDFTLPSDTGEDVTLSSFRGSPVVLDFYPRDNSRSSKCSNTTSAGLRPRGVPAGEVACSEMLTRGGSCGR